MPFADKEKGKAWRSEYQRRYLLELKSNRPELYNDLMARKKEASNKWLSSNQGKEYRRKRRIKCAEKIKKYKSDSYAINKEKILKRQSRFFQLNKSKIQEKRRERYAYDASFRLAYNLRNRLRGAIKRGSKSGSAVSDLGCSIEQLKIYLALMFSDGMSWENYGKWHIDHIKPLSSFDLSDRSQVLAACNYKNLQPLWAVDNIRKKDKILRQHRADSAPYTPP